MEPITINTDIDLKTYYKISMIVAYRYVPYVVLVTVVAIMAFTYGYTRVFDWEVLAWLMGWMVLAYGLILPSTTWFVCKKNMQKVAMLAEGAVYTISDDFIETVSPSCTSKSNWKFIKKVEERSNCFIMYTGPRAFHYLNKTGFASVPDMEQFRQMVKANHVKAYFK